MTEHSELEFFLGANTPHGFVSRFDQITQNFLLKQVQVIKGGPGTGKSSLMKKIAEAYAEGEEMAELIRCSSDPQSVDAVILPKHGTALLDGTPPHVVEPQYPGAFETIIDLYQCFDREALQKDLSNIRVLFSTYKPYHERACRYLSAAASLISDCRKTCSAEFDRTRAQAYAKNTANRELKYITSGDAFEKIRFLSAVTPDGITCFNDTVEKLCDRIYLIEDEIGEVSSCILQEIRKQALKRGVEMITCYCVMAPYEKIEHLFFPELRLGFVTSNRYHPIVFSKSTRKVKAMRFVNQAGLSAHKQRLKFQRKAADQLIQEASRWMKEAKDVHDLLEQHYMRNVDFKKLDGITKKVIQDIR